MRKIILLICLVLLCGCNRKTIVNDYDVTFEKGKGTYQYLVLKDRTMFLDSIKNIKLNDIDLHNYFSNTYQTLDDALDHLTSDMNNIATYRDGGSKLYEKNDFRILVCNTVDGNKDIYFGDVTLTYKSNYCNNVNIDTIKEMLGKTTKIELHNRDNEDEIEVNNLLKTFSEADKNRIVEILLKSEEYNGPINLPYAGRKIVFYDSDNNKIGEFIFCDSYLYFLIDYHALYVGNKDISKFNEIVKLD